MKINSVKDVCKSRSTQTIASTATGVSLRKLHIYPHLPGLVLSLGTLTSSLRQIVRELNCSTA